MAGVCETPAMRVDDITQEDTMTNDSYARTVAVGGAARPASPAHEGIAG